MEQVRLFVAIGLSVLVLIVWEHFFVPKEPVPEASKPTSSAEPASPEVPQVQSSVPLPPPEVPHAANSPKTITINTPLYAATISENGAALTGFKLKHYRESAEMDSPLKELIPKTAKPLMLRTGFSAITGIENAQFVLRNSQDSLTITDKPESVSLVWNSPEGIVVEKTFLFSPQTYLMGLTITIYNTSDKPVQDSLTLMLSGLFQNKDSQYGFEGPSALIGNHLEQIKLKKIKDKNTYAGKIQWIAIEDRYFLTSVIPKKSGDAEMRLSLKDEHLLESRYAAPAVLIPPQTQQTFEFDLFFGPKSMNILKTLSNNLDRVIDFGLFDFIAKPCLWLLNFLHQYVPNYGVSIIILTLIVKILLWPLGTKSYKSMNEMKRIQPLMTEIREKYQHDKKKMNEEFMNLYRVYKINPMGGCLPMLLQIPVFFALYRMLYQAIELRHAPFIGWITDLSAPDRLFRFNFSIPFMEPPYGIPILTLIMGATMLIQQKMSPPPGDPTQAKMMMLMPIFFTVIFINFSSGLVLYWLVSNILSIAQQYYISKKFA